MAILDDTRADWNARPPLRALTRVPWADRVGVSWHWIGPGRGPSAAGAHQKCLDQVREWQRQHQAKGWKDIGYPALICQHARAIEGRGLDKEGSHSPGVNWVHVGVQFMVGEDAGGPPSAAMLARSVKLRYDLGQLGPNIRRDWGHRDDPKASTACPGTWITNWVHTGGPTKYAAPTTPTSPEEDDDMPTVHEVWTTDLTKTGTTVGTVADRPLESPLDILTRVARNVELTVALVRAQDNAASVAAEVIKALPADATLDEDTLARAFVAALTQLATPKETTP